MQSEKGVWAKTHFEKQAYVQELWTEIFTQFARMLTLLHMGSGKSLNKPPDT